MKSKVSYSDRYQAKKRSYDKSKMWERAFLYLSYARQYKNAIDILKAAIHEKN